MHDVRDLQRGPDLTGDVPDVRGGLFVLLSKAHPVHPAPATAAAVQDIGALPHGACPGAGAGAFRGGDQSHGAVCCMGCGACPSEVRGAGVTRSMTDRGFAIHRFADSYGMPCSLQMSSAALEPMVWLGVDDARPQILASQAGAHRVQTKRSTGWVPYPVPGAVLLTTRMHLSRAQVAELLPALTHFVKTGELP